MFTRSAVFLLLFTSMTITPLCAMESEEFEYTQEDIEYAKEVVNARIKDIHQIITNISNTFDTYDETIGIVEKGKKQRFRQLISPLLNNLRAIYDDINLLIYRLKDQSLPERRLASKSPFIKENLTKLNASITFILLRLNNFLGNENFLTPALKKEIQDGLDFWRNVRGEISKLITPIILQRHIREHTKF